VRDPAGNTFVARQRAGYPFHLCKVHRYAGDPAGMATLYVQSVAGGLYENDFLAVDVEAQRAASVHLTTQASTIVHGMPRGGDAAQRMHIRAAPESLVEYLPDATIMFPTARLASSATIEADAGATVIAGDSFLAHDPRGRGGCFGWIASRLEARRPDGTLLFADRWRLPGEAWSARLAGVSGPYAGHGTLLVLHTAPEQIAAVLRAALAGCSDIYAGASLLPNSSGAWVRILASDGAALRSAMLAVWAAAREAISGTRPQPRRK
jgi:urease accessory protein